MRQTSNTYRLVLPLRAALLLPAPPLPDDVIQTHADRAAAIHAFPVDDLVTARIADPWLVRLLAQMAERVRTGDLNPAAEPLPSKTAT